MQRNSQKQKLGYYSNCVNWPSNELEDLEALVDEARPITFRTLKRHVSARQLADLLKGLGYAANRHEGLTIETDYAVGFYKSKLKGNPAYYIQHSRIEHVFA